MIGMHFVVVWNFVAFGIYFGVGYVFCISVLDLYKKVGNAKTLEVVIGFG